MITWSAAARHSPRTLFNFLLKCCKTWNVITRDHVTTSRQDAVLLHKKAPYIQGGPKKWGHRLMTIILSDLNRFKKINGRFLGIFVVEWILKIPPQLAYVTTLPCKTLMSAKQAINDKLQGSVATYWRCGRVVNQIRKDLLLSLSVTFFKSVNIWKSYKQERDSLVHFFRLSAVCWPGVQSAWDSHALVTLPNIHRF